MKALVLYDSLYGNTEKIAREVARSLKAKLISVKDACVDDLNASLIVIGSPTQGGRPTKELQDFLDNVKTLKNIHVATFDTRIDIISQGNFLKAVMKLVDYAAPKLAKTAVSKGAILVAEPEGFIVKGKEGPLENGELERARLWTKSLLKSK